MERTVDFATILDRICDDATLRRQFLWLRAREKGDTETARELEASDPTLSPRMAELKAEFVARGDRLETPEEERQGFGRMLDEFLQRCSKTFAG